ncbi:PAS domain S-box protein [Nitrospira sp. Kam-Ns4a]
MRLPSPLPGSWLVHYGLALLAVLLGTGARMLLDPVLADRDPFVTFVIAVLVVILYTNRGASLFALGLALAAAKYLFIAPRYSLAVTQPADLLDLGLYAVIGLLAVGLIHGQRRARHAAEVSAADALAKQTALEAEIRERRRAEEALRTSEQQFSRAFEHAAIGMALVAPDGRWLKVNRSLCDLTGYAAEELRTKTFQDITHPDDLERDLAYVRQMLSGEIQTYQMEKRYIHKQGHVVWILLSVSLVRDAEGRPAHFIAQIQDITERKRAEAALRTQTGQLELIAETMTKFLENGDWREASAALLRGALRQTESEYGFIGVVAEGPALRILAHEGLEWHPAVNREFYEQAVRTYEAQGYLEFTNLDTLFGRVITSGATVIANDPATDPRSGGLPPGHPPLRHFMGVPVVGGAGIVGMIGVANRPGGYTDAEQAKIELLAHAVGVLYDGYLRREREANLEAQLRQMQKMEAVGQLAGGIAHDFNNLLMVINGYSKLLLDRYGTSESPGSELRQIREAGDRAAALVQQLLAFSRKQVLVPVVVDLNGVVAGIHIMLQGLLGEGIDLALDLDRAIGRVKADVGQLEQVLINLVLNARDAMPQGGKLTIETRNRDITESNRHRQIVRPGRYVTLSVSDTGCGMDRETQARIFEPFFTTKERGKGTGLGLSTVYGIVKQSGGYVFVYSEPGQGSTFRIYLPRVDEAVAAIARPPGDHMPATGTERILLVEDDPAVRTLLRDVLLGHGYTVLEARHGVEALLVANRDPAPIHLLLTDVVMPQMSGRELAERLRQDRPDLKVLYISGYSEAAVVHHGVLDPGTVLLQKPFDTSVLLRSVREVLETPRPS